MRGPLALGIVIFGILPPDLGLGEELVDVLADLKFPVPGIGTLGALVGARGNGLDVAL